MMRFELPGAGHALFSERADGNMSSVSGEQAEYGARAREQLRAQVGVGRLVRGYQVHGSVVECVREQPEADTASASEQDDRALAAAAASPSIHADGHATSLVGVGVMVLAADCLPVVLATRDGVAAVHAGWRGLAAGVLEEGVRVLRRVSADGEMVAIIGPGAGSCCYEVGEEVHGAFGGAHRVGRLLDLKAIARDRLLAAGVAEVRDVGMCTICDGRLFSHRREGERAGRQVGVAWLS